MGADESVVKRRVGQHVLTTSDDEADAEVGQDTRFERTGDVAFVSSDQRGWKAGRASSPTFSSSTASSLLKACS